LEAFYNRTASKETTPVNIDVDAMVSSLKAASAIIVPINLRIYQKSRVRGVAALCPIAAHPANISKRHQDVYKSYEENAENVPLINKSVMETFLEAAKMDHTNPGHFVTLSNNLREFPPFTVTAQKDPFRDDGVVLHKILHEEGAVVNRQHYDGFGHVFWNFPMPKKRDVFLSNTTRGMQFILFCLKS
jgi:versiconal hemiacetal acetate esterase